MSRRLIVSDGRRDRELLLVGRIVVGRDPVCDIGDGNSLLSRRHAEFVGGSGAVIVRDLGSRNGIFLNGMKVAEGTLQTGDSVQIGPLRVRFVEDATPIGAVRDAIEADATALISPVSRPVVVPPVGGAAVDLPIDANDETCLVQPSSSGRSAGPATPPALVERTRSVVPAANEYAATRVVTMPALESGPTLTKPFVETPHAAGSVATNPTVFVYVQVATLAALVFTLVVVPMIVWQSRIADGAAQAGAAGLVRWLTLPAVAVLLATYIVGTLINRRAARAPMPPTNTRGEA